MLHSATTLDAGESIVDRCTRDAAPVAACDLCGGDAVADETRIAPWVLRRCGQCGLVRLDPRPSMQALDLIYDSHGYYTSEPPRLRSGLGGRLHARVQQVFWNAPGGPTGLRRLLWRIALWPLRHRFLPVPCPGPAPVLDIGCGNGQRLLELQAQGCTTLVGVEPTASSAAQAQAHTDARIHHGLLEEADLPQGHFQLAILNQVLEHVPSPTDMLRQIRALLRPGGALYLTVPNYGAAEARCSGRPGRGCSCPPTCTTSPGNRCCACSRRPATGCGCAAPTRCSR